jgi:hypothetical protein
MTIPTPFTVEVYEETIFWSSYLINDKLIVSPGEGVQGFCFRKKDDNHKTGLLTSEEAAALLDCFVEEVHCERFRDLQCNYIAPVFVRFQKHQQQLEIRKRKPGHLGKFRLRLQETTKPCTAHSRHLKHDEYLLYDNTTGQSMLSHYNGLKSKAKAN